MAEFVRQTWTRIRQGGFRELPERALRLKFELPYLWSDKRYSPELRQNAVQRELKRCANSSLELLAFSQDQLAKLAKYKVPAGKRFALLERYLRYCAPLISDLYNQYKGKKVIPEPEGQRQNLSQVLQLLDSLVTGYQQVFSHDYYVADFRYGYLRKRLRCAGVRILELIQTEQRISALRYQVPPARRWRDVNQLFFILWRYEQVDLPVKLAGCLRAPLRGGEAAGDRRNQMASPQQLYIAIQLFGAVDVFSWPSENIQIVDGYLKMMEPMIRLRPDPGGAVPTGHLLTFFAWDRAPLYIRSGTSHEGLLIDISALKRQANNDYASLCSLPEQEALKKISPPLSVLEGAARVQFVDFLNHKLQPRQRRDRRVDINEFRDFTAVFGFMSAYQYLESQGKAAENKPQSLGDMLAGRSSLLADDSRDIQHGEWFVVNNSRGGIQVKTRESKYLTAMSIGQLVSFKDPDSKVAGVELGVVARFMRLGQGEIAVSIIRLAEYVETIALQTASLHKSGEAWPAFLIRSRHSNAWQLVVHDNNILEPGETVFMRRKDKLLPAVLGQQVARYREFAVIGLRANQAE